MKIIRKQQINFSFFLSDWHCEKFRLTELPSHGGKVTSDKKIVFKSYNRFKAENGGYGSHFSLFFETTSIFLIAFSKLILEKFGFDGFSGPWWKIDVRYKLDFKRIYCEKIDIRCQFSLFVISKSLWYK